MIVYISDNPSHYSYINYGNGTCKILRSLISSSFTDDTYRGRPIDPVHKVHRRVPDAAALLLGVL